MAKSNILRYFQTIWSEGERTKIVTNWRVIPQFFIFLPQCSFRGSISFMAKKSFFYLFDNWIPYPQPFLDLKIDFFFQNQLSAMCEIPLVRYRNFLYQLVVLSSDFIIIHCACAWLQFAHYYTGFNSWGASKNPRWNFLVFFFLSSTLLNTIVSLSHLIEQLLFLSLFHF